MTKPQQQQQLQSFNTLALPSLASRYLMIHDAGQLQSTAMDTDQPYLILGGGSNLLLAENFEGLVLHNGIRGIALTETDDARHLHVGGGENWHQLVQWCVARGIGGLENLALIPGLAGAAPVQNIGAYGVEFAQLCEYVDVVDLRSGESRRFLPHECDFGYRHSRFKLERHYFITHIGIRLSKSWQPVVAYGELKQWAAACEEPITPSQLAEEVCRVRAAKLPDPGKLANAGSFFKNPVVPVELADALTRQFPAMPRYPAPDGVKLAAGWLIDRCGLKGYAEGDAQVHERQALVLVNRGRASARQMLSLAAAVRRRVADEFGVALEPEVNIIGARGYIGLAYTEGEPTDVQ